MCLVTQSCPTLRIPMGYSLPGSSVHGILQARIPERVTMPSSRGSSLLTDWTQVSHTAGRFFTIWTTREAPKLHVHRQKYFSPPLPWASLVAQLVKNSPAMRETWVRSLSWEDPLEKGKATLPGIPAWRIPCKECPWGCKESDRTEWLSLTQRQDFLAHTSLSIKGKKPSFCSNVVLWTTCLPLAPGFPDGSAGKGPACSVADIGDIGSIPGSRRSPKGGHGKPIQHFPQCGPRNLVGYSP